MAFGYICIMRFSAFWGFLLGLSSISTTHAQFVQVGEGSYLGTFAGPIRTSANMGVYQSKFAYIYPKSTLGNLKHGDSIFSLEFYRAAGASLKGNHRLKIWLSNTQRNDFGSTGIIFSSETTSAQKVIDTFASTYLDTFENFYRFTFIKPYVFDSITGENLVIYTEFNQADTLRGAFSFYFEGTATVSGFSNNQTQFSAGASAPDSLNNITQYKPTLRLNYPRYDFDLEVRGVYTLGKIPLPLGNPDSVKTLLRNVGKKNVTNHKLYTYSLGQNKQKDSFQVSLAVGKEQFFQVPSLSPSKKGTDSVYIESVDKNTSNNKKYSIRLGNENIYSYRDITLPPAGGGIGFNGAQGDFVARFQSNQSKNINQISVAFGGSGRLFQLVIYDYDSTKAQPGKVIWVSDSLTSKSGTYIYDIKKPVKVEGSFFVGVRQLDLNNVSFGFQFEVPVRPRTFFYTSPIGDTTWYDFHPDAPYKFIIEPRLQADYDFRLANATMPRDTFNIYDNDTAAPTITIQNVGVLKPSDSVEIVCEIRGLNLLHYKKSFFDTLSPGMSRTYTFPKEFVPYEFGAHKLIAYVKHKSDAIKDNDTIIRNFYVGVTKDVMVRTLHVPSTYSSYVYKIDTVQPLATIMNAGYDNTANFDVVCQIFRRNQKLYEQKNTLSLPKFQTKILFWPTYKANDTGQLEMLVYTALQGDRYTPNDSVRVKMYVYKKQDFIADSILSPRPEIEYKLADKINVQARVINDGVLPLDNSKIVMKIFNSKEVKVFEDSSKSAIYGEDVKITQLKNKFTPPANGVYRVWVGPDSTQDKYPENDTLSHYFTVGTPTNFSLDTLHVVDTMSNTIANGYPVSATLSSLGFDSTQNQVNLTVQFSRKGTVWYNEKLIANILPGEKKKFTFGKNFKPLFTGPYEVLAWISHPKDKKNQNDTIRETVYVEVGKDALVTNISSPIDSQIYYYNQKLDSIQVSVINQGRENMTQVAVNCQVFFEKSIVLNQQKLVDLKSGESQVVVFYPNKTWLTRGKGKVICETNHLDDQNIANDSLVRSFEVRSMRDLVLNAIDSPSIGGSYVTGTSMWPQVNISNAGDDSSVISQNLKVEIYSDKLNGNLVYSDQLSYPQLGPTNQFTATAVQAFKPQTMGVYWIKAFAVNNTDENSSNDTLSGSFQVLVNSVENISNLTVMAYPNPSSNGEFTLSATEELISVAIFNATGQEIARFEYISSPQMKFQLNVSGLYFLRGFTASGSQFFTNIVVE
ncbi:MAG: hypothetical protein RL263_1137 [Bacteroidota bacterium]